MFKIKLSQLPEKVEGIVELSEESMQICQGGKKKKSEGFHVSGTIGGIPVDVDVTPIS